MFNLILVSCGAILLIYSAALQYKLNINIKKSAVKKPRSYPLISVLIYLFVLGYIAFLVRLVTTLTLHGFNEILVSVIFFFGAFFVAIVLKINQKLIISLTENTSRLDKLNVELENKNKELQFKTGALKTSEEKFKKRSKELEETLEDFYTIRLSMEEQIRKGTIEEENKKIKERLDKIKNEN